MTMRAGRPYRLLHLKGLRKTFRRVLRHCHRRPQFDLLYRRRRTVVGSLRRAAISPASRTLVAVIARAWDARSQGMYPSPQVGHERRLSAWGPRVVPALGCSAFWRTYRLAAQPRRCARWISEDWRAARSTKYSWDWPTTSVRTLVQLTKVLQGRRSSKRL